MGNSLGKSLSQIIFNMPWTGFVKSTKNMDPKLGKKAKDIVTGFEGIIIGKCEYLYGCNQYGINPGINEKDGKLGEINWFDEGRIQITGPGISPETVQVEDNGAENSHPNIN